MASAPLSWCQAATPTSKDSGMFASATGALKHGRKVTAVVESHHQVTFLCDIWLKDLNTLPRYERLI
jgi:hypothetical protein